MGRIFITGDLHGQIDIRKLNKRNFSTQEELTKEDYLIIVGDFGLVWHDTKEEQYWTKWLSTRNFTTLFIDGNHENFDRLDAYPVEEWNGGKVHFITPDIIHLMRGQVFEINGRTFFTMGGGSSIDKQFRKEGVTWWPREIPSPDEFAEGLDNLELHNWKVDHILTHTTSRRIMNELGYIKEQTELNTYLNMIEDLVTYKSWFFGHFHQDKKINENHYLLYRSIVEIT